MHLSYRYWSTTLIFFVLSSLLGDVTVVGKSEDLLQDARAASQDAWQVDDVDGAPLPSASQQSRRLFDHTLVEGEELARRELSQVVALASVPRDAEISHGESRYLPIHFRVYFDVSVSAAQLQASPRAPPLA